MFECRRAGGIGRHTGLKILWTFVRAGSSPALGTSGHDIAGWSSQVARRAHNPKVAGSNPAPATNFQGGVAQMARACGSYPQCHWFDSSRRHQKRKTLSFKRDSENRKAPSRRGSSLTCPHLDHRQEKGQDKRRNHDMGVVCFFKHVLLFVGRRDWRSRRSYQFASKGQERPPARGAPRRAWD